MHSRRPRRVFASNSTKKGRHSNAELAKQTPDAATSAALQKDVSDLQSQFDQKRLAHILEMKKIDPNFAEGRGMGPGMGHAPFGGGQSPFGNGQIN